eukprot:g5598.t1
MTTEELQFWRYSSSTLRKYHIPELRELCYNSKVDATNSILCYANTPLLIQEKVQFSDHEWTDSTSKLFASTQSPKVFCIQDHQPTFMIELEEPAARITPLKTSGLIAVSTSGNVHVYLHQQDTAEYVLAHRLNLPDHRSSSPFARLKHICLNADSSQLLLYIHEGEVYRVNLETLQSIAIEGGKEEDACEIALPGSHCETIVAMDLAIKMDRLVTASTNMKLRVWRLFPLRCEVLQRVSEDPLSIAVHPIGIELVVSYLHSIKVYNIADGALLNTNSIPEGSCRMMKYSPAGSLLAVVMANSKDLLILDSIHYEERGVLDGHPFPITDFCWSIDGMRLVSISKQALYVWSIDLMRKVQENLCKGFHHVAVSCHPSMEMIFSADISGAIRMFKTRGNYSVQENRMFPKSNSPGSVGSLDKTITRSSLGAFSKTPTRKFPLGSIDQFGSKRISTGVSSTLSQISRSGAGASRRFSEEEEEDVPVKELVVEFETCKNLQFSANRLVYTAKQHCLFSALDSGFVRVLPLSQEDSNFTDYSLHQSDIQFLAFHHSGEIAVTLDAAGTMLVNVVAFPEDNTRGLLRDQATSVLNRCFLQKTNKDSETVVLPITQHRKLLETLNSYRTSSVRSANEMAFRMKETTNKVRSQMMDRVREVENEQTLLKKQMADVEEKAQAKVSAMQRELESAKEDFELELSNRAEWMYSKLAFEIDRSKAVETNIDRLKLRYHEEVSEMVRQTRENELRCQERNNAIEAQCQDKVEAIDQTLRKTKEQFRQELAVETMLNEQEIERVTQKAQYREDVAEARYLHTAEQYQSCSIELNKSKEDYQTILADCAKHIEDKEKLNLDLKEASSKIELLETIITECHEMMIKKDDIHQDLMKDYQHSGMVNTLLNDKISKLEAQLVPLLQKDDNRKEVISKMTEGIVKDMSWIRDLKFNQENQKDSLRVLKSELKAQKLTIQNQSYYIKQFQTQLWNIISNQPQNIWQKKIHKLLHQELINKTTLMQTRDCPVGAIETNETVVEELKGSLIKSQELLNMANSTSRNLKRAQAAKTRRLLTENTQLTEEVHLLKNELNAAREAMESQHLHMHSLQRTPKPPLHHSRTRTSKPDFQMSSHFTELCVLDSSSSNTIENGINTFTRIDNRKLTGLFPYFWCHLFSLTRKHKT